MNEILDEIEKKNIQTRFSILSLIIALITIGMLSYLFWCMSKMTRPPEVIAYIVRLCFMSGILVTILSFVKKEPSTWFKWVGAVVNILIFLLVVGALVFALLIDSNII